MAKALQCPSCGTKKRIDSLPDRASFQCEQCGEVLKVPPGLRGRPTPTSPPTPARRPATSGAAPPPAPRRRSRPTMTAGGVAAGAGSTQVSASVLSPPGPGPAGAVAPVVVAPRVQAPDYSGAPGGTVGEAGRSGRGALPLPLRILAWVVALPLGLAMVGGPARKAGYLSSQKLLDVIVKSDMSRFVPIAVVVVLWALVTAILVTIFVEGGRRLMLRRRAKHASRP